ncbi:substrate-binding domain-containing protein [Lentimicrobium sp.]|jgi:phosphate transport system substrate-binding protein|uniref:PstS family phosphate ABC transporter substrate-binding protein n=1 Tax=Lentimicrobium sp. TaxID=2034841 RepID=UPI002BC5BAC9|nr:substrate-binding domain-containing protein [Lentimicrobium sp.]HPF63942.1 substrate-binding domain-containing protein [Lentimicrobium sp.]HPJ61658.1 substrate-binding domain-containing protein [Lentimicrobium sp.]HPR26402.1 substrate-binding domain-containing protein [Lentimicrobium sp.]HRW68708.1 substrate-binding domain-containing protein [Lentimicrobium sp.]
MKRSIILSAIAISIVFSGCASREKKDNTITLSGAFALYPLAVKWTEEYGKINPEVRFNVSGGGAGKGMADALSGAVDLGMFSREIADEEKQQGVWWVGLTIDAVVPTISSQNPYLSVLRQQGLSREDFKAIFMDQTVKDWGKILNQPEKAQMTIYTRSDACGAAETWAKYLGGHQENLAGIGIFGDPGMADAVAKDKLGMGFNNTIFAYDINTGKKRPGIEIAPIDINDNGMLDPEEDFYETFDGVLQAIGSGVYPSPPARELYFVAKGKPQKQATLDFIRWCLTEGQQYVKEAGYVPIDSEKIESYLKKLK